MYTSLIQMCSEIPRSDIFKTDVKGYIPSVHIFKMDVWADAQCTHLECRCTQIYPEHISKTDVKGYT